MAKAKCKDDEILRPKKGPGGAVVRGCAVCPVPGAKPVQLTTGKSGKTKAFCRRPAGKVKSRSASLEMKPVAGYRTTSPPCPTSKSKNPRCPVQLVYQEDGRAYLRYCFADGRPGRIVPVANPIKARDEARAACKRWREGVDFNEQFPNAGLGGVRKRAAKKAKAKSRPKTRR